jgi:prepilin peptidase CpaA
VVLAAGVIAASVIDIRSRRIPNVVTGAMTGAGLGLAAAGVNDMTLALAGLGFLVGLGLMLPGHMLGATGAGDVKLMAAIGTLVGPALAVNAFLFTAVAGGVLAFAVSIRRQRLAVTVAGTARLIAMPSDARSEMRGATASSRFAYGPAIAVGSIIAALVG